MTTEQIIGLVALGLLALFYCAMWTLTEEKYRKQKSINQMLIRKLKLIQRKLSCVWTSGYTKPFYNCDIHIGDTFWYAYVGDGGNIRTCEEKCNKIIFEKDRALIGYYDNCSYTVDYEVVHKTKEEAIAKLKNKILNGGK